MRNKKLTPNFSLSEFFRNRKIPKTVPTRTVYIISEMANMLQWFRDNIYEGKTNGIRVDIISGVRTMDDYTRLIKNGLHPSITSDHFYGIPIPTTTYANKGKYGGFFCDSVGATDIQPHVKSIADYFVLMVKMVESGNCPYNPRQIIFEVSRKGTTWIHIANDANVCQSEKYIDGFKHKPTQFLYTKNGGKTYKPFDSSKIPTFIRCRMK